MFCDIETYCNKFVTKNLIQQFSRQKSPYFPNTFYQDLAKERINYKSQAYILQISES